jgi:thioredoxin-like negative regulator of GroEL
MSGVQLALAATIAVVAVAVAAVVRRRRPDAPTQPARHVPTQLDRGDFAALHPQATLAPWMVVVFSSSTCSVCAQVWSKVQVMASSQVAVIDVGYTEHRDVHQRYAIDSVPLTVIVDAQGVVHEHFLGPMTATDLWAAVARVRDPER